MYFSTYFSTAYCVILILMLPMKCIVYIRQLRYFTYGAKLYDETQITLHGCLGSTVLFCIYKSLSKQQFKIIYVQGSGN